MANGDLRQLENIGFVSSRIMGTDGVSLEIGKWAEILERIRWERERFLINSVGDYYPEKTPGSAGGLAAFDSSVVK